MGLKKLSFLKEDACACLWAEEEVIGKDLVEEYKAGKKKL